MNDFPKALEAFLQEANRLMDEGINARYPDPRYHKKLTALPGSKYVKIAVSEGPNGDARSVWCFIDKTNGNVLKAASWKTPAKNFARGNIYDLDNGLSRFCWTGMR